jgi:hypothetical protein
MKEKSLAWYRQLVTHRAMERTGDPFPNSSHEHARIVIEALFSNANRSVKILTTGLNRKIYGAPEVLAATKRFLSDEKHTLEILFDQGVDDKILMDHPLVRANANKPNLRLYSPPVPLDPRIHFTVADSDSYRVKGDPDRHSAIAAFGDETLATKLEEAFDWFKANAQVIEPAMASA